MCWSVATLAAAVSPCCAVHRIREWERAWTYKVLGFPGLRGDCSGQQFWAQTGQVQNQANVWIPSLWWSLCYHSCAANSPQIFLKTLAQECLLTLHSLQCKHTLKADVEHAPGGDNATPKDGWQIKHSTYSHFALCIHTKLKVRLQLGKKLVEHDSRIKYDIINIWECCFLLLLSVSWMSVEWRFGLCCIALQ